MSLDEKKPQIDFGEGHGNKRRAIVPIGPDLLKPLRDAKEIACSDYVVEYHGKPCKTLKNGFEAACVRAGLKDVTPHNIGDECAPSRPLRRVQGSAPNKGRAVRTG